MRSDIFPNTLYFGQERILLHQILRTLAITIIIPQQLLANKHLKEEEKAAAFWRK